MEAGTDLGQDQPPQDKAVNMDDKEKSGDFCLVCFSRVDRSKSPKQTSLLSNNLNVIFLLKNVLQVPNELLIGNFKKCGSPSFWISLCEHCSQLTSQAMERHLQILTLVNQLRTILKLITDKMRDSPVPSQTLTSYQDDKKQNMKEKRLHILKKTREFVTNYDYNTHLVNPFIEGDKLARELDEKGQDSSSSEDSEEERSAIQSGDDGGWGGGGWQEEDDGASEETPKKLSSCPSFDEFVKVDGKWKCHHCDKIFGRRYKARNHELEEHAAVPGRFKCILCGKVKNSAHYLNEHIKGSHLKWTAEGKLIKVTPQKPAIKEKSEEEKRKDAERKRAPVQVVNGIWKCRLCDKGFRTRKSFCRHLRWQHPPVPGDLTCDYCDKEMNSKTALYSHQRNTHKVNWAGIPITVAPRPRGDRKKGNRRAKPKDWSTCHLCGKSYRGLHVLNKHLKYVHEKQFDIGCHVCGMGMWSTYGLNIHLLRMHKEDPATLKLIEEGAKLLKCQVRGCSATFWKESGMEEHTRKVHEGGGDGGNGEPDAQKRFNCVFCGKLFGYWRQLKVHESWHKLATERPGAVACDVCGAKFNSVGYMKRHRTRLHKEIRI